MKQGGTGSISHLLEQPDVNLINMNQVHQMGPGIVGLGTGIKYILEKAWIILENMKKN